MKWPIDSLDTDGVVIPQQHYWEQEHADNDYQNVFSVTEDEGLRARVSAALQPFPQDKPLRILVPGCGSRTLMERHLIEHHPTAEVIATDFPAVVDAARRRLTHPQVSYEPRDSRELGFESEFDAAVIINSVLSSEDGDNRKILGSVAGSLRAHGILIGLFPTIYSTVDVANCDSNESWRMELVDLKTSRYFERTQNQVQIFYTPLRLRAILREAGFSSMRMEIFFCDSPQLRDEARRIYGYSDDDVDVYELFVVAQGLGH